MTTFICGYWKIKNNVKHSYDNHYKKLIPETFTILKNCNIVFFYDDDDVLSDIKKYIQTNNIIYKKISIDSLETYDLSNDYLETCKLQDNVSLRKINTMNEKGLVHYQREYKKSGEDSFRKVFTVWTSKLFLVNKTIDENPFNTNYFAWIDVSASRFNRDKGLYTQFYSSNKLFHFGNMMKYYGETITINASFLIAHKNIWKKIIPLYEKQLQLSKNSKYTRDEETILYLIWKDNKDLFCNINKNNLKFMHIGKCGGTTISYNFKIKESHCKIIVNDNDYIILWIRNPINRLISAYNFAKYLINFDCSTIQDVSKLNIENNIGYERIRKQIINRKKYMFSQRFDYLITRFKDVNDFLESLTSDNVDKMNDSKDLIKYTYGISGYNYVGFFKGYNFYLDYGDFIEKNHNKIIFVGTCENMTDDMERLSNLLNIKINNKNHLRKNKNNNDNFLSSKAIKNILNFYKDTDYKALQKLVKYNFITKDLFEKYHHYNI